MNRFTVEETNLLSIYHEGSKAQLIENMTAALPYMDELLIRRAIGASRANIVTLVLGAQLTISVFVCIVSILISFFLVQGMGLFLPVDSPVAALEYPILSAVVAVITSVVVVKNVLMFLWNI